MPRQSISTTLHSDSPTMPEAFEGVYITNMLRTVEANRSVFEDSPPVKSATHHPQDEIAG